MCVVKCQYACLERHSFWIEVYKVVTVPFSCRYLCKNLQNVYILHTVILLTHGAHYRCSDFALWHISIFVLLLIFLLYWQIGVCVLRLLWQSANSGDLMASELVVLARHHNAPSLISNWLTHSHRHHLASDAPQILPPEVDRRRIKTPSKRNYESVLRTIIFNTLKNDLRMTLESVNGKILNYSPLARWKLIKYNNNRNQRSQKNELFYSNWFRVRCLWTIEVTLAGSWLDFFPPSLLIFFFFCLFVERIFLSSRSLANQLSKSQTTSTRTRWSRPLPTLTGFVVLFPPWEHQFSYMLSSCILFKLYWKYASDSCRENV